MNNDQSTAARPPVLAWAVVHNADMALTQSAVIAQAWSKAGLEVIPLAPATAAVAVPDGFAVVPKRLTQAMDDVLGMDGWQWEDLLAAAEAITEQEYAALAAAPAQAQAHCDTCNDHGAVGNILTAEPCPDCTAQGDAPHPPAAPWKDHQTARLVNDLRDCALQYHSAGQLRERIAHIVAPLCDQLKATPAALHRVQDDARDAARYRRIRNGPHSDRYGDVYAMTFQGDGDLPVKGDELDRVADAARAAQGGAA